MSVGQSVSRPTLLRSHSFLPSAIRSRASPEIDLECEVEEEEEEEGADGGWDERGDREEKQRRWEKRRGRRVADSSRGTLGWRFSLREMSNGLWRACLSCLVLHPFHHYMPSISPSLNLPVSSLCSPSSSLLPLLLPPPTSSVSSLTQTGWFDIVCRLLGGV